MDINHFFEINKKITHNNSCKDIPQEFSSWEYDDVICENFFNWIRQESDTGSLRLDIASDISEVVREIKRAQHLAIPHRKEDSQGWRSIVLHGLCSIMTEAPHTYIEQGIIDETATETWTDASKFFPNTLKWIKENIPFNTFGRIRIMILDPNGYILPHKDFQTSFLGGGLNVAFTNPAGVEFAVEDNGLVPWKVGDIRMINIGKLHSVRNLDTEPRIHLLAYPASKEWPLDGMRLVCKSYRKMKENR